MTARLAENLYFEDVDGTAVAVAVHHADADPGRASPFVVMAHGFHGNKSGGSRHFVDLARALAAKGVSSVRFDQAGSGDSAGSFEDASFDAWVGTIEHFARRLSAQGHQVGLLGESMGGSAAMAAAASLGGRIQAIALWSPDPNLEPWTVPAGEWMEEAGQRTRWRYWREAAASDFMAAYRRLEAQAYIVFGTADPHMPEKAMRTVEATCKPGDRVRVIEGLPHSSWPVDRWQFIQEETIAWFLEAFR